MSTVVVRLTLPALIFLALSACSGPDPGQQVGVAVAGTAVNAPPSTEGTTAVERPRPLRQGNPAISVASLPVGDPEGFALADDGSQCVHVSWIQSDSIPQGVGVLVTGATFVPDVYRPGSFSCERPTCAGHVFHGTDLTCDLAIRPWGKSETSLLNDPPVSMSLTGQVLCADFASDLCRTFTREVRSWTQKLSLKLPAAPLETPDTGIGAGGSTCTDVPPNLPSPSLQRAPAWDAGG